MSTNPVSFVDTGQRKAEAIQILPNTGPARKDHSAMAHLLPFTRAVGYRVGGQKQLLMRCPG